MSPYHDLLYQTVGWMPKLSSCFSHWYSGPVEALSVTPDHLLIQRRMCFHSHTQVRECTWHYCMKHQQKNYSILTLIFDLLSSPEWVCMATLLYCRYGCSEPPACCLWWPPASSPQPGSSRLTSSSHQRQSSSDHWCWLVWQTPLESDTPSHLPTEI